MKNILILFLAAVFILPTANIADAQSQGKITIDWVKAYLKQNPKTGIAFRYGKAEYIGLSDKAILDQMGGVEYNKNKFDQLRNSIQNASQQTNGLKNAKILDTNFDDVVAEKDRGALIAFMNQNDLDLLQIIDFTPLFTGIRDGKNGLSGNIVGVRYNLFIESKFYFKTLLQDNSKDISSCRADFDWLSVTNADETNKAALVSFTDIANNPRVKENAIDSIAKYAYASTNFNNGINSYKGFGGYGEINSKYDGIVLELNGENVKINIKRANVKGLMALASTVPANYSVIERVQGDNPITFWNETEYDIVVASIKINESIDDYSICEVNGISKGFAKEKLIGLPVANGAVYGIQGHLPAVTDNMQLVGKRFTPEQFAARGGKQWLMTIIIIRNQCFILQLPLLPASQMLFPKKKEPYCKRSGDLKVKTKRLRWFLIPDL
ncbi:MAG: hypothetical protein HC811_07135 [Flammeovirgaceae bacterium]|nr:hypothetical protein [Flammeovirgaceae bacterium]